jgi:hypothetical protein
MSNEIRDGIMTVWNSVDGNDARSVTPGGLWNGRAKEQQNMVYPYATFTVVSAFESDTMGSEMEGPLVQFTGWTDKLSSTEAWTVIRQIKTLYRNRLFAVSGDWGMIMAMPVQPGMELFDDVTKHWGVTMDFRFMLGKNNA